MKFSLKSLRSHAPPALPDGSRKRFVIPPLSVSSKPASKQRKIQRHFVLITALQRREPEMIAGVQWRAISGSGEIFLVKDNSEVCIMLSHHVWIKDWLLLHTGCLCWSPPSGSRISFAIGRTELLKCQQHKDKLHPATLTDRSFVCNIQKSIHLPGVRTWRQINRKTSHWGELTQATETLKSTDNKCRVD